MAGLPATAQVTTPVAPHPSATSVAVATEARLSDALAGLRPLAQAPAAYESVLDAYPMRSGNRWTYRVSAWRDTSGRPFGWGWQAQVVTEAVTAIHEGSGFLLAEVERTTGDVPRLGEPWRPAPADSAAKGIEDTSYLAILGDGTTNVSDLDGVNAGELDTGSFWLLQLPLEVGKCWPLDDPVDAWHMEEQVAVDTPARRFDGCCRLEWQGGSVLRSRWLCPGIGFVREASCSTYARSLKEPVTFGTPKHE